MHIGIWTKVYGHGYMNMGIWTSAVQCSVVHCFKCVALHCVRAEIPCFWVLRLVVVMDSCLVVFLSERESE